MDNAGWHANRRAQRDSAIYDNPQRGPDGRYRPVEQLSPLNPAFVGGFHHSISNGYLAAPQLASTVSQRSSIVGLSAVERSQRLRVARMNPYLQFMVGPLLRYDTIDDRGIWHGACLIVTADAGSIYDPHPTLTYDWDPGMSSNGLVRRMTSRRKPGKSVNLGPHPADPHSPPILSMDSLNGNHAPSGMFQSENVPGHEIWVYDGEGGTYTFWRFLIKVPLTTYEMAVKYRINDGQELEFIVPARHQNMRWAAYSCNGFSAGVNTDEFCGPGFKSGYDPVWVDLLAKHQDNPFHVLVGGGDQIYCDGLTREPELQEWIKLPRPDLKKSYQCSQEIESAIDRFYFNHYCSIFRSGAFARANSCIPMLNMADDHDLIDGFGSYPEDLQMSPVFRTIGARGYFFFLLFQCFINVDVDGVDDRPGCHTFNSLIVGAPGAYVPFPSHSFLASLGPRCFILLLDCRAERRKDQVCSQIEYNKVMERMYQLPQHVEHLVVLVGIPIAYPRMNFMETALESKFNPLVALGRKGSMGMGGMINKFNSDAELLDDLNDHWTAKSHKKERNAFVLQMQRFAEDKHIRVSFLSGDVHCAAVGFFKTLVPEKNHAGIPPPHDSRYMINVVTSAIVNTPPPGAVQTLVSNLATKVHKTMHYAQTDESMIPLFATDTDGSPAKSKFIMGRRNWCSVRFDENTYDLVFDIRVEREKGVGVTIGYEVRAPAPRW